MKKLFALLLSVAAFASVSAYDTNFTVINVSKDNVDATQNEPQIGDVLFFQLNFSGNEPVADESIAVDISNLKDVVTFVSTDPGTVDADMIQYPDLNNAADIWEEEYGFYARINDTTATSVSAAFQGTTLTVPLNLSKESRCEDCDLSETGPESLYLWIFAAFVLLAGFVGLAHFKKS